MERVRLTPFEMWLAGMVGVSRNIKGLCGKYRQTHGVDPISTGYQNNCTGTNGEMVLAKHMKQFWSGAMMDFKAKDVGKYQVRTNHRRDGDLILHPEDQDDDVFVLVLAHETPVFHLAGWLRGREAKNDAWWRDGAKDRPAFFAPQVTLHPMSTLP